MRNIQNHALIAKKNSQNESSHILIGQIMPITTKPTIISATFKDTPADFIVTEKLNLKFDEQGEHLWLYVKKTGMNTTFVAKLLAQWAEVPSRDVGYSGLKDRHAITHQWFSIRLPKKNQPEQSFADFIQGKLQDGEEIDILQQFWHGKKLHHGTHESNHFIITLKNIVGEKSAINAQLEHIAKHGVPNYFGEQRFGHDGNNLTKAQMFFEKLLASSKPYKPSKKDLERNSLLISAVRSHLFNQVLTLRVADNTWDKAISGDVFNLDGTGSVFTSDIDDEIRERIDNHDIHPTIALYGVGENKASKQALDLENQVFQDEKNIIFTKGLQKTNVKIMRRSTRLIVQKLSWQWQNDTLVMSFTLPKGTFATVVLHTLSQTLNNHNHKNIKA